jgi:hypothetical protein
MHQRRVINELLYEEVVSLFAADELALLCECSDRRCRTTIVVPREHYERVRQRRELRLVANRHDVSPPGRVVRQTSAYTLLEAC